MIQSKYAPTSGLSVSERAFVATNAMYGKYGDKIHAIRMAELAECAIDAFGQLHPKFDTSKVSVIIRSFRCQEDFGDCFDDVDGKQILRLNVKLKTKVDIIRTISHELIHADQMQRGDLKIKGQNVIWKGIECPMVTAARNYKKYRGQPWEVEAFDNQDVVAEQIGELLGL